MSIVARVANGVEWLDEMYPGWADLIDLEQLDLASCTKCVLGQIVGDFCDAPELAFRTYGFSDDSEDSYPSLTAEWRRVITERREAAP